MQINRPIGFVKLNRIWFSLQFGIHEKVVRTFRHSLIKQETEIISWVYVWKYIHIYIYIQSPCSRQKWESLHWCMELSSKNFFIDRLELSSHYKSWKIFWQISNERHLAEGCTEQLLQAPGIEHARNLSNLPLWMPNLNIIYYQTLPLKHYLPLWIYSDFPNH